MLEIIVNVFNSIISILIGTYMLSILHKKINLSLNYQKVFGIVIAITGTFFNYGSPTGITKIIISFIIILSVNKIVFEDRIRKSIASAFTIILIIMISEVIYSLFVVMIFNNLPNDLFESSIFKLISTLSVFSICFIIVNFKLLKQRIIYMNDFLDNEKIINTIIMLFTLVGISILFFNISKNLEINNIFLLNLIMILLFVLIAAFLFKEKITKQYIIKDYDILFKYINNYEKIMELERIENHEHNNQLITIKGMTKKANKPLCKYIENIISNTVLKENNWIDKLKYISNGGLKGLIHYKIMEMNEEKLEVDLNVGKTVEQFDFSSFNSKEYKDLCRLIGIYLDNAKEASEKSGEKRIGIEIYMRKNILNFVISNSIEEVPDLNKINNKGFSTKGLGRGYGLFLANEILNQNHKFAQEKEIINQYYVQYLSIKK